MYTGNDREKWARKNRGWAFTFGLVDEAQKFDWVGDFPEVTTDGYLTGQCVEPTPDGAWTVVDVIQPNDAPPYVQEGSGASMAVVNTADLRARRAIEGAAPSPGGVLDGVMIEQGDHNDWTVRIYPKSHDAAKLVAILQRMKEGGRMSNPVNYYDSGLCEWRHVVTEFARQTEDQWRRQSRLAEVLQAAEDCTPETHEQAWAEVWRCLGWNVETAREQYLERRAGQ